MNKHKMLYIGLLMTSFFMVSCATPRNPDDAIDACKLTKPPDKSAQGYFPPHAYPMRLFPVAPGDSYSGCQWIWISYGSPDAWDYGAVTLFKNGVPITHDVKSEYFGIEMSCRYDGENVSKLITKSPDEIKCASSSRLRALLNLKPKENTWWDFW
ncbi:MAG: hypothetical protein WC009_07040 [Methylotenera sp.]